MKHKRHSSAADGGASATPGDSGITTMNDDDFLNDFPPVDVNAGGAKAKKAPVKRKRNAKPKTIAEYAIEDPVISPSTSISKNTSTPCTAATPSTSRGTFLLSPIFLQHSFNTTIPGFEYINRD